MRGQKFRGLVLELKRALAKGRTGGPDVAVPKRTLRRVIYALQQDPRYTTEP